tara:strand:- start:505 stop:702 length:198 start_codon:yes stop_codon:yes gene_type:complete
MKSLKIVSTKKLQGSISLTEDGRLFIRIDMYFEDLGEGWYEYNAENMTLEEVYSHETDTLENQFQ